MRKEGKLAIWASDVDEQTLLQAARTSRLPFVHDYVALMPDAHFGIGSTVGSVIPTLGAVIPAAVGVDLGCGMIAAHTGLKSEHLPDDLEALMPLVQQHIPSGVGKGRRETGYKKAPSLGKLEDADAFVLMDDKLRETAANQLGSLGSGNHFVEVCLDETDDVWVVLHSGSRGVGNKLAQAHINKAKGVMKQYFVTLEDPDLAYFVEGTDEFKAYIKDMLWAQDYALANREVMMAEALRDLYYVCGYGHKRTQDLDLINCHHNFTQQENHHGKNVWLTRKGAISARAGQLGVIPGSMGAATYIVEGLGNEASFQSCSHGAGRRMSRGQARRELTTESLTKAMEGKVWNSDKADQVLDEHPDAYKPIDQVMADQADLVKVVHTLHQVFNYKGTS